VSRKPRTLLEVCTWRAARANGRDPSRMLDVLRSTPQGMRITQILAEWSISTAKDSEHDVATNREHAQCWGITERQAERQRAEVYEVFARDEFRTVVAALARDLRARGVAGDVRSLQAAELPAKLVAA
jgi:hypothetical protein